METIKRFIKVENGKRMHVLKFGTGKRVEIPINSDRSVRWYEDKIKTTDHCVDSMPKDSTMN